MANKIEHVEGFTELKSEKVLTTDNILVTVVWLSLIFLYVFFIGEPDLQDAIIYWLMK